ncbi:diacylglycerol/lipid kinase family protein [Altererythrobacter sp. MF3-039]|uniref:diacylglycerol/lipid kinase family protein n=1 Tax=Altererythrobacter sp. MF3-039 TaxID=3252901 RepID=UPI00390C57F5
MSKSVHQFGDLYGEAVPNDGAPQARATRTDGTSSTPRVGVVYNPRSHRNKGQDLEIAGLHNVTVSQPHGRDQITQCLADFARDGIDYLIINGGDGTVRDVLTCGQAVFGDDWPELAVLPKGKTNALNVDLGAPGGWTLAEAVAAWDGGQRITRRPIEITRADGESPTVRGFIFGAGAFTIAIRAGQDAHRLGAFDSLAVGVTALWGAMQVFFGGDSNPWRSGVRMDINLLPEGQPMPRSRFGDPGRRAFLLASTLENFPMGVKAFGPLREGLKLLVLDHPRRRLMALIPAILAGYRPAGLSDKGLHQIGAEAFEIELEDQFILDGEAFPEGHYRIGQGAPLTFIAP